MKTSRHIICVSLMTVQMFMLLCTHRRFTALWILSGTTRWAITRRNFHPLTPIMVISRPYLLPPSITIHGILPVQFTCMAVFFHNLSPSFLWSFSCLTPSTSYSIHFFTQSLSCFHSTCSYHRNLLCCNTKIMSSNLSLPLNPLLGTLSCSFMPLISLTILISAR